MLKPRVTYTATKRPKSMKKEHTKKADADNGEKSADDSIDEPIGGITADLANQKALEISNAPKEDKQAKLFDIIFKENEITWQAMIYELVKKDKMNPWDIDITHLAERFFEMLKSLQKMDMKISGKVILAAAILLRLKSHRLIEEDLNQLNRLIAMSEETENQFFESLEQGFENEGMVFDKEKFKLIPKTPQPRKRKVSVYDLVEALQKALEVKRRRVLRQESSEVRVNVPEKRKDISLVIHDVFWQIKDYFEKNREQRLTFSYLVPKGEKKADKVYTFIPLLYLDNQRKIDLLQDSHLGEIEIKLHVPGETKETEKDSKPESESAENSEGKEKKAKAKRESKAKKKGKEKETTQRENIENTKSSDSGAGSSESNNDESTPEHQEQGEDNALA
jgi:segregation and condensation protein A